TSQGLAGPLGKAFTTQGGKVAMGQVRDTNKRDGIDHFTRLSREDKQRIHEASVGILERIGVRLYLEEAVRLLQSAGATVTRDSRVRIPADLVKWALDVVPKSVTLYDRGGEPAMKLQGERCYYGPGSDCLNIIDHRTAQLRKPVISDVAAGARLCDGLRNVDFVMSMVLPTDVDETIADIYQMEAMFNNTTKPIITVSYETDGLVAAVEMAEAIRGGAAELQEKPLLACYINVISGAVHNEDGLRKLLYLAEKGLPTIYIPGSNAGVTSPATMPGAVALDNAGVLVGLVLSQLKREGTPFIWSAMDGISLDMRTLVSPYAYAERGYMRALAEYYGVPSFAVAGGSDAKMVDQQAGIEAALSILVDSILGGNIIHDLGYLESGRTFSFVHLAICDEIVSWVKGFLTGVEVSEETLALDVIEEVGFDGQYLDTQHTLTHFRDFWYPDLFERATRENWAARGGKSLAERAADRVDDILEKHTPASLPADTIEQLRKIVSTYETK
ncbi:MAG: trimethylamine methyltransferase family protein, partial [bacterium]